MLLLWWWWWLLTMPPPECRSISAKCWLVAALDNVRRSVAEEATGEVTTALSGTPEGEFAACSPTLSTLRTKSPRLQRTEGKGEYRRGLTRAPGNHWDHFFYCRVSLAQIGQDTGTQIFLPCCVCNWKSDNHGTGAQTQRGTWNDQNRPRSILRQRRL